MRHSRSRALFLVTSRLLRWLPGFRNAVSKPFPPTGEAPADASLRDPRFAPPPLLDSLGKAQQALLRTFNFEDGYWCGDLRADTTIASDYVMLLHYLGRGESPKIPRLAAHILSQQLPDGG